jgi:hypothetical protein
MPGVKGRSGGRRVGAGSKSKADLLELHELIDARIGEADWNSIIGALVKKAKRGDVQAFRELRACRFGQIPVAPKQDLDEDAPPLLIRTISIVDPCPQEDGDEEPVLVNGRPV